ncbi:hypothetical protein PYH69_00655 [Mammaliicoccus lentus]|uniref:Peptide zinc metalloprotease protein n=1 Tax=Mammaliicoccus lentus TaxID=42858 RepID=A0AAX3W4T0_MAMLE|nr:hypothetical protein [Mammaliicoccus lentus]WHI60189.1 hypothetical protein PYH69_00655 [Mammaliicoccus lentus]
MFTKESIISTNLKIVPQNQEYIVGKNENYIILDDEGVEILKYLNGEYSIGEIENELLGEEEVDLIDFVETLYSLDLIDNIDGKNVENIKSKKKTITKFDKFLASFFFNKICVMLYILLLIITPTFCIVHKVYPNYKSIMITDYSGLNILIFLLVSWLLLFIHEMGHYLASIKLDIKTSFSISTRYFWVVIEANLNELWQVESSKRYVPFLGGIFFDITMLFTALLLKVYVLDYKLLDLLIFILAYRMIWQFLVFLRTDIYYLFLTFTNQTSLNTDAKSYLKSLLFNTKGDFSKIVRLYSIFIIIGFILSIVLFLGFQLPSLLVILKNAYYQLINNNIGTVQHIDGIITFMVIIVDLTLWIIGFMNKKRSNSNENNRIETY